MLHGPDGAGQRKVGVFFIMISFYARHVLNSAYTTTRGHGAEATAVSRNLCTRRVQMIRTVSGAKQGTDACRLILLMNHVIMSKKKRRKKTNKKIYAHQYVRLKFIFSKKKNPKKKDEQNIQPPIFFVFNFLIIFMNHVIMSKKKDEQENIRPPIFFV